MATNKSKDKEKEQTPAPAAPDTAEAPASPTVDPTEEAKKQAQAIIDAANAEADKIVSNAKKQAAVTGNARAEPETKSEDDPMEELVDYFAPVILGKADQTIFCQVNGENIRIKRGVPVKIKRKFKMVLDQSAEQEMAAYAFMEEAQKGSAKALADL